ncbi:LysE family translocator [Desulfoluna spongiiphila]|uniref:Threonine/homoserine/homoserine lactone efflux protein n=1 Tax=Desulfoluna spongiiphila TaxID=419481 RepID=A0A1G5AQ91_9BACT|nr:LysE family translocator [Desulfoluna spongiiphila]SCX80046.1 Threonine/homoserine/homoserine lactone efflux protein [Desulfoluna spongiiphila]VVS91934.1 amino acid exporter protein leue-type [Desulfoluna spongiiphila]
MEHNLIAYTIAITLLTITPGIDTILVIRNTTRGAMKDGFFTSLGICSGLFVHATFSAVGISVILLHSAVAFGLLKLMGAAYLIWLGIVSLRSAATPRSGSSVEDIPPGFGDFRVARSLREGFLSNVLNPKTIVFYMAFLPQFIDPARPALVQALGLAGLHFVIAMVWQTGLAAMVDRAKVILMKEAVQRTLDGITGVLMVMFGVLLGWER